jgi:hypothetical protein
MFEHVWPGENIWKKMSELGHSTGHATYNTLREGRSVSPGSLIVGLRQKTIKELQLLPINEINPFICSIEEYPFLLPVYPVVRRDLKMDKWIATYYESYKSRIESDTQFRDSTVPYLS